MPGEKRQISGGNTHPNCDKKKPRHLSYGEKRLDFPSSLIW